MLSKQSKFAITSELFDENTFYSTFIADLSQAKREIIVESPFISSKRKAYFRPVFDKVLRKGVKIYIFTRDLLSMRLIWLFNQRLK